MKRAYEEHSFHPKTLAVIEQANQIIALYAAQGYDLTLRQLYYQFVSRDLIPNRQNEYKKLGEIVSKGRRAGLIDWDAIVDRTRELRTLSKWDSPQDILRAVASQYRVDLWQGQDHYVEVWFEKDALLGVFERAAQERRLPHFSCRGYTSDSEIWAAAQRLRVQVREGRRVVILHFGDHDPSGIDMTRDIGDRLALFGAREKVEVRRLALNMAQVEEYEPPPNPAKETDSRFAGYLAEHGDESWELDALEPAVLAQLVEDEVSQLIDDDAWAERVKVETEEREQLEWVSDNFDSIVEGRDS